MIDEQIIEAIVARYVAATRHRPPVRDPRWVAADLRAAHAACPLRLSELLIGTSNETLISEIDNIILHVYHGAEFGGRMVRDWRPQFAEV